MRSTRHLAALAIAAAWGMLLASLGQAMPAPGDQSPTDPAVIDNTGAARFRIPIEVPPGAGGFAPRLALTYSSRSGDGPFGVGWSLGIPEIRCSDRFGVPNYANCAKYELGSDILEPDPQIPNEYHTFVESFQRIRYLPATDSWTVEQPNGTKLIFGETPSHRISQGSSTARWLLQRMEDAFQNKIFLTYETTPSDVGLAYPKSVFYGAGATPGAGPREIRFEYQVRPDTLRVYSGGIAHQISRRLLEIQVFGHNQLFKRYGFGYDSTPAYTTDRSRLSWVQEFGSDCSANLSPGGFAGCTGLPRQQFRYRDAPVEHDSSDGHRVPFGAYPGYIAGNPKRYRLPQLIGDINGDGLADRLELRSDGGYSTEPAEMRVLVNTGTGFSTEGVAATYQASFDDLTYLQPRLKYKQIPRDPPTLYGVDFGWMYAMCEVTLGPPREATLSAELFEVGVTAQTSSLATLEGTPSSDPNPEGWFEPRPTVKLVDLDADGLADLVVSVRLSGVKRHFNCPTPEQPAGQLLAQPVSYPEQRVTVVFRNTGSGWENNEEAQELADGLPPFEEVIVKSSYQTELDDPVTGGTSDEFWSPCGHHAYQGFEYSIGDTHLMTAVCHVPIDLSPQFIDFNGDGLVDLAVLQRDDPDRLWTGANPIQTTPLGPRNNARTVVWIQTPDGPDRWARAHQYDLPYDAFVQSFGFLLGFGLAHVKLFHDAHDAVREIDDYCDPSALDYSECLPATYSVDSGVRIADLNGDGLADVVWSVPAYAGGHTGVLLNTGSGTTPSSAWCASNFDDKDLVGGDQCAAAAVYVPPAPFVTYEIATDLGETQGWLRNLNGDGLLDFVKARWGLLEPQSWIQSPAGTTPQSRWDRDTRFDFDVDWEIDISNPLTGGSPSGDFSGGFEIFDVNGDGADDFVGDQQALLSVASCPLANPSVPCSRHSDLLESIENGRGGRIELEYAAANLQRDAALEAAAQGDVQPATPEGGDASLWRPSPVVSRIKVTGQGFAPTITEYRYARPRYCSGFRSDLGFRLVEETRPDGSRIEEYFYQDHGRAGHTSRRLIKDAAGQLVHQYQATWDLVAAAIPGSIPGVFRGRLASEESANKYGGASGAVLERTFSYNDGHGYNFVSEIRTERPTGTLIDTRIPVDMPTPVPVGVPYVIGRIAERILSDGPVTLRHTKFTYLDLDGDPTGLKPGSRSEFIFELVGPSAHWVDTVKLRYDNHGNVIEAQTPSPSPAGGVRSELFCYDGDAGEWCPVAGTSHSVMVASKDPLGKVTRITRDLRSGIAIGVDSDYTDEPARRIVLDPFGRPTLEFATPTAGSEKRVAESSYAPGGGPLRIERFEHVNDAGTNPIHSAEVFDSFGGLWKTIWKTTASGTPEYAGTVTYRDAVARLERTSLPLDCGTDAACSQFPGETQPHAREVLTDAVGRPVRVDTPDGFSLFAYRSVGNRWGAGSLDAVLEKNGKGDLAERAFDGGRVVWVDECPTGVAADLPSLAIVACATLPATPDTTRYTYEATGEIQSIYDPRAVASNDFESPDHRLRYKYDTLRRVVQIDDPDLDGLGNSRTTYSDAGNVASTINARGQVRSFEYDLLGRLVGIQTPNGEDDYTIEYRSGERQRWKDSSPAYERVRTYDGWGRVTQTKLSVREEGALPGDWSGTYFMDFSHDLAGRPEQVLYPESSKVRYEYTGAYLKRVCDLGDKEYCTDNDVVKYIGGGGTDVEYDELGRRKKTHSAAGTRTFTYDGSLPRLTQDRFDAPAGSPAPYWLQLNYVAYDELGNLEQMTGTSQPGDIELGQEFSYDRRNRVDSWTKGGVVRDYGFDDLGNLTTNAGVAQVFNTSTRPHAIQSRANGSVNYGHDEDGNVTSIVGGGSSRYFQFDSANRMVCADTVENGCALNRIHYDVDGRRVLDDDPTALRFTVFVEDSVSVDGGLANETRIEIWAFGERVAFKRSGDAFRTTGGMGSVPWGLPPAALGLLAGLGLLSLLAWAAQHGALILVIQRPGYAGASAVLVVVLILGPVPGVSVSRAGGGGEASFYWELTDPLGTGMVMLDETGARQVHRTYSPFGVEHGSVGTASWLPRHFAGHRKEEDSGLLYMQARWMDPQSGTFLSVDPVVADSGDPQAFNAYTYARNNPVNLTDPTGAFFEFGSWFVNPSQGFSWGSLFSLEGGSSGSWGGLGSLGLGDIGGYGYGGGINSAGGPSGTSPGSQREGSRDPTEHQLNQHGEIEISIVKPMQLDDEEDMGLFETFVRTPILRDLFRAADGLKETFIGVSVAIGGIFGLIAGNFSLVLAAPALFLAGRFGGGPTIGSAFAALNRGSVTAISQGGQFAASGLQRAASGLTFDSSLRLVGLHGVPPPRHH